jgi:hypothetical protein
MNYGQQNRAPISATLAGSPDKGRPDIELRMHR